MKPDPSNCRWLDRHFGDVCRRWPGIYDTPMGAICTEPPCKPCKDCGYQPITPETPAWDDPGEDTKEETK